MFNLLSRIGILFCVFFSVVSLEVKAANTQNIQALVVAAQSNETPTVVPTTETPRKSEVEKVQKSKKVKGSKKVGVAAALAFFLGGLGIHRFYLGYKWQGIVQLLTAGGFGIWFIVDFVRILMRKLKPATGDYV